MLTRDAGTSGSIVLDRRQYQVDGWELFEGDADSPHMCRGWFRCLDPDFAARKGWGLRLDLVNDDGVDRCLDVRIQHVSLTKPLWEFVADR